MDENKLIILKDVMDNTGVSLSMLERIIGSREYVKNVKKPEKEKSEKISIPYKGLIPYEQEEGSSTNPKWIYKKDVKILLYFLIWKEYQKKGVSPETIEEFKETLRREPRAIENILNKFELKLFKDKELIKILDTSTSVKDMFSVYSDMKKTIKKIHLKTSFIDDVESSYYNLFKIEKLKKSTYDNKFLLMHSINKYYNNPSKLLFLNSPLFKDNQTIFKKLSEITENSYDEVLNNFFQMLKKFLKNSIEQICDAFKSINLIELNENIKLTQEKMKNVASNSREYSDIYYKKWGVLPFLNELFEFFDSTEGKKVNETLKLNNILKELYYYLNEIFGISNNNFYFEDETDRFFEIVPFKYKGYDHYFREHIIHDMLQIFNVKGMTKEEKYILFSNIRKFLGNSSVFVNSFASPSQLLEIILTKGDIDLIRCFRGYITDLSNNDIIACFFEYVDTETIIEPTLDLIENINKKNFYLSLYRGDSEMLELLIKRKSIPKIDFYHNKCSIYYLASNGSNCLSIYETLLKHIEFDNLKEFKYTFWDISTLWGNDSIVKKYLVELEDLPDNKIIRLLMNMINLNLVGCLKLSKNLFNRIFSKYLPEDFLLDYTLARFASDTNNETWEYLFEDIFNDVNIDLEITHKALPDYKEFLSSPYPSEATIGTAWQSRRGFNKDNLFLLEKLHNKTKIPELKQVFNELIVHIKESNTSQLCFGPKDLPTPERIKQHKEFLKAYSNIGGDIND